MSKTFFTAMLIIFSHSFYVICGQNDSPIHITIWCEAPFYGPPISKVDDYYDSIFTFIKNKNDSSNGEYKIDRIISRIENPGSKGYYYIGGDNDNFLKALIRHKDEPLQIYVLPWLNETEDEGGLWDYPLDSSITKDICPSFIGEADWNSLDNNIARAVLWIQLANEYLAYRNCPTRINGLVYESEDATPWDNPHNAFKKFLAYLPISLKSPYTPAYSNDSNSQFKFTTASQYNFRLWGTALYVHEIFPQYYNLGPFGDNNLVDATSGYSPDTPVSSYYPVFPKTLYTNPELFNESKSIADFFYAKQKITPNAPSNPDDVQGKTMNDRRADINCMFSTELALDPEPKTKTPNPFHYRDSTISGASKTGTINAFGVEKYKNWIDFISFLKEFRVKFNNGGKGIDLDHFAIFQYNMFPPEWNPNGKDIKKK